eukprot:TRINITY_DN16110_c0_g3_i1.p1 TRINITY_DN16110_c0_g3~~TRINITY_DN16110_c0_g3_i1.p1  ORF type:complete len:101 (+),score=17.48 TRINITY_DN16110_c0_g3_i1:205-507(+)
MDMPSLPTTIHTLRLIFQHGLHKLVDLPSSLRCIHLPLPSHADLTHLASSNIQLVYYWKHDEAKKAGFQPPILPAHVVGLSVDDDLYHPFLCTPGMVYEQ